MKMKKKVLIATSVLAASLCIGAVAVTCNGGFFTKEADGAHQKYTLTLGTNNKLTAAESTAKQFTRNTSSGNPITFATSQLNNRSEDTWFAQLASGFEMSNLGNTTMIKGIDQITIKSQFKANNGGYRIEAGTTTDCSDFKYEHTEAYTESAVVTKTYKLPGAANYFKITNIGTGCGTYINEISVEFSCIKADGERDAKEKASGDLLYGSYLNQGCDFDKAGFSNDMRCSDVSSTDSGYSVKFHADAGHAGYPVAQIELPNEIDLRGYGLTLDIKLVNAHNWFGFTALDSNENYIIRKQYGGININPTKDLGNYVSAEIPQTSINNESYLEPGRSLDDLAHVKYLVFTFNFDDAPSAESAHEVTIDNIKLTRGFKYEPPATGVTYKYLDLGENIPLATSEFIAFDVKFDNPTVHQELGFAFYEGDWDKYFGNYWVDSRTDTGEAYFEETYAGLKLMPLTDGYNRIYVDLSKLNKGSSKPTEYIRYIFFQAPNNTSNRGSGIIDVRPSVCAPSEVLTENKAFVAGTNCTVDFPRTYSKTDGLIYVDFTFTSDSETKARFMIGNWTTYVGYFVIYKTTEGTLQTGVTATKLSDDTVRVIFNLSELADTDYKLLFIEGKNTTASGTINIYHKYS